VNWLDPVRAALDSAPAPVEMFFRDDDAGWRNDRLLALLDRFAERGLPLDLAVIPTELDDQLAAQLRGRTASQPLSLHQHGFAHRNHEPDGRKYEFGPHRAAADQRRDIEAGAARLRELLDELVQPIFTPPWNRCTVATGQCLVELGFSVLSREWRATPLGLPGLHETPIRVDWLKPESTARLTQAIRDGDRVGVMFHHAVMDGDDLARADEMLALLGRHERVRAGPILDPT
jgi:hypothetical protein